MLTYIIRRLAQSLAFVFIATLVIYTVLVVLMPAGPAWQYSQYANMKDDPYPENMRMRKREIQNLEEYFEVDKPWPLNYLAWLFDPTETSEVDENFQTVPKGVDIAIGDWRIRGSGILTGDFNRTGRWSQKGERVTTRIGAAWPSTALLVSMALLISVVVPIPLGIFLAARPNSRVDHAITFISAAGLALPTFGLGLLLITALAIIPNHLNRLLGWEWIPYLPAGSPYDSGQEGNFYNRLYHATLPALTLALPQIAILTKYVRSGMLEVLGLDYIRTAWAKGLPAWRVMGKHAFRNALIPLITVVGLALPGLASSAIIVEYVFGYQGMGQLMFTALGGCVPTEDLPCVANRDVSLSLALLLMLFTVIAISNMLADILYVSADPRVDYKGKTRA